MKNAEKKIDTSFKYERNYVEILSKHIKAYVQDPKIYFAHLSGLPSLLPKMKRSAAFKNYGKCRGKYSHRLNIPDEQGRSRHSGHQNKFKKGNRCGPNPLVP